MSRLEYQVADVMTYPDLTVLAPRAQVRRGNKYVAELAKLKAEAASAAAHGNLRRKMKVQGETLRKRDQR